MDAAGRIKNSRVAGGRGNTQFSQSRGGAASGAGRPVKGSRAIRTSLNQDTLQRAVLRGMGTPSDGHFPTGFKHTGRYTRNDGKSWIRERDSSGREPLPQIIIRGFKDSKAAANPDGGIQGLLAFLERKASATDSATRDMVRIKKVCLTLCFRGHRCHRSLGLSGLLSFQAKLSERRPKYSSIALTT